MAKPKIRYYIVKEGGGAEAGPYPTREAAEAKLPQVSIQLMKRYKKRGWSIPALEVEEVDVNALAVHPVPLRQEVKDGRPVPVRN